MLTNPLLPERTKISLRFGPDPNQDIEITANPMSLWQRARGWDVLMRNRGAWIEDEKMRENVADLSRKDLKGMGIPEKSDQAPGADLVGLAQAKTVEVGESVREEGTGLSKFLTSWILNIWDREMRRMPWESLLTMAVQKFRNKQRVLIYRRLLIPAPQEVALPRKPLKALFIESAPGALWDQYNFEDEFTAVQAYLKMPLERLQNPTMEELAAYVQREEPAIIHLTGLDGYQGFALLHGADGSDPAPPQTKLEQTYPSAVPPPGSTATPPVPAKPTASEGVYFRNDDGEAVVISPEGVATALCAGARKPLLVTFNLYNSSARLASGTVEQGAAAAIGFQDFIDDTVAEIFFTTLFWEWSRLPGIPLMQAFRTAVESLYEYSEKLRGSGVTLWTSQSLLDEGPSAPLPFPSPPADANIGTGTGGPSPLLLKFDIDPLPKLNYSVLHNGRKRMFDEFRIYKFSTDPLTDLHVEVTLSISGQSFTFQETFEMRHHILDLSERIAVGLTSFLSRSLRESIRTTVFVRARVRDKEYYCRTFDVSLLAVDEWIDDESSGRFLPSFILPRDPIIPDVLAKAQHYLMALSDDPYQGFDGYQSCDEDDDDPAEALAPQARAIWYTLQHDYDLKYINPPPTFTEDSQRLRTPSEILKGGRGTCIDLALLLAACFEQIGLDPVVFLMTGHAFVGYWTDENAREAFLAPRSDPSLNDADMTSLLSALNTSQEPGTGFATAENTLPGGVWRFDSRRQKEILAAVKEGSLVALEATYLTNASSFYEACTEGARNLENEGDFDSMLEITLARAKDVTPLPLVEGRS